MRIPKIFLRNYLKRLHRRMISINLERISIYTDAEAFLREMFNPRSVFYAFAIAWDVGGKAHTIHSNLPLRLSYNDTRRYQGEALKLFRGQHIHGGLNLCIFAYSYEHNSRQHKSFLRKLDADVQRIFATNKEASTYRSSKNLNKDIAQTSENIKHHVATFLEEEGVNATNIFEGLIDVENIAPNKNLSTINHYRKTGGFSLSIAT